MRLKVDNKVVSIDNNATLNDLIEEIGAPDAVAIRFGYPPLRLDIEENSKVAKLVDIGLSSGEKVRIVRNGGDVVKPSMPKLKDSQAIIEDSNVGRAILQVHTVPDDNSCLFHSISYSVYKDISLSLELRQIVSSEIQNNKAEYNDAILGRPNREYAAWILDLSSWGGGIEIAILSKHLNVAIYVLDVDINKFEKFNDDKFNDFIIILFNGIHYDCMEVDYGKTVFQKNDEKLTSQILSNSLDIAKKLKANGYCFNTQKAKIICNVCRMKFVGERDVAKHAESTGHTDFGQAST
ncbi:hypothetical protein KAFR_0D00870 [Kazachstania africana CBS 2517]|uniref:Ubiquitin thioesterase OTU n=1 Tax=Kazachstania africana (strain ATCC 22294 / BCRC 22015 / CBS 2517 / CECT 1963 / NBRC 1671 / NRRL Y-8276) TaxID=1071382 RepID=H2ATN4_KAZAF|nr:hypothetical protein KAFR_0D00870 [Kazachstania africana CBS 2517]CCF57734.1 hypothetical protein KAFR_0D00870 [Kazachstania africana CBS 2517]